VTTSSHRPRLTLAAVVLAALLLASCGTFTSSSEAFSVDGTGFSREQMNSLASDLVGAGQIQGSNGTVGAKDMASLTSTMIQYTAGKNVLKTYGATIDAADISAARAELGKSELGSLSDTTVDLLAEFAAMGKAFDSITSPADIRDRYESSPMSTGVLCVSDITVATEAEAREVLDRLAEGEKFAKVAAATTLNKEFKVTGGNVEDVNGMSCFNLSSILPKIGPTVLGSLAGIAPGTPTIPVQDEAGWHVLVHRPWSEISADHKEALKDRTGRQFLAGYLATADIRVNSTYGTWNPVLAQVE
jgi:hypothetical protein